jgi:isoleucyl-tRNA synthetase
MFEKVADAEFVRGEHEILKFWNERAIFHKLRQQIAGKTPWSFLDGPITANNPMGVHHAWGRTYKDTFQRYWAMNGRDLRYQNGFDCQGLWVEVEVEKQLGLGAKSEVEKFGIDKFAWECKRRVLKYAAIQTEQSIRLGYWMEWDDPAQLRKLSDAIGTDETVEFFPPKQPNHAIHDTAEAIVALLGNPVWGGSYFTFSTENNETIWTFLKKCHQRGKIYRGYDVMPWSGRGGSAYSQMEVADGRKLTVHRSCFVRFPIVTKSRETSVERREPEHGTDSAAAPSSLALDSRLSTLDSPEYLLIWTTTPWTLTSNVAAAVNPDLDYVKLKAKRDGAVYYFAKDNLDFQRLATEFKDGFGREEWAWPKSVPKLKTLSQIFKENGGYDIEGTIKGAEMIGWQYSGPFDDLEAQSTPGGVPFDERVATTTGVACHRVIDGGRDFKGNANVVAGEGTGIVHIAPGCGDVDHQLGAAVGIVGIAPLGEGGCFLEGFGEFTGKSSTDPATADLVFAKLKEKGLLVNVEQYPHIYPHCWRTGDELVFRLVDEWFINMDWREEIMDVTRQIRWLPDSIQGQEREVEWLTNMRDWMISKKRFWGLALPIWINPDDPTDFDVIGSLAELKERAVEGWDEFEGHTPHKPWIDKVKIRSEKTGAVLSRVPDVGNPWLDAGIVSFSTMGFNSHPDYWRKWYPADLVTECFPGQFRNWFYSLLSMATMMMWKGQEARDEGQGTEEVSASSPLALSPQPSAQSSPSAAEKRPFKTLLGHRLVMNEAGKPMHKSDGTAIWFEEAAEQLGVDTMRWMYLQQNPASDLRFGTRHPDQPLTLQTPNGPTDVTIDGVKTHLVTSAPADETRRMVLIPLWNSYAFFVNYARLDEFDPTPVIARLQSSLHAPREESRSKATVSTVETVSSNPAATSSGSLHAEREGYTEEGYVEVAERPEIDRWILSNLQALIVGMRSAFEDYNTPEACRLAAAFVDDLSNWYIRRNRRRFWRSKDASDTDKLAAYQTLYEVLVTLTKLLAPLVPFLSERMYQNLVRGAERRETRDESQNDGSSLALDSQLSALDSPESVHLCEYPTADAALLDAGLNARMATAQAVVTLGHKLRDMADQRVRQPLSELRVSTSDSAARDAIQQLGDVIREELNVKQLTVVDSLGDIVKYTYKANLKTLGPKYGKLLNVLREKLPTVDGAQLAPLRSGESVTITLDGHEITLAPDDVQVGTEQAPGWVSGDDRGIQLALSTALTPALLREGMARDFIRQIQQLRKDANLEIENHIRVGYSTTETEVLTMLTEWSDLIRSETLADNLTSSTEAPADAKQVNVGDAKVSVWIEKA